jgi:hypothetical protein
MRPVTAVVELLKKLTEDRIRKSLPQVRELKE